ncbi:MAG: hypothetical protein R2771_14900 [Saprospiraceae bacterium]
MMSKLSLFILIFSVLLLSACNNSADSTKIQPENKETSIEKTDTSGYTLMKENRDLNKERIKAKEMLMNFVPVAEFPDFLQNKYYLVDYISEVGKSPKDIIDIGEWFRFNDNYSYEHGFFDKLNTKGRFILEDKNKKITIVPDDENEFPEQFNILNSDDVMVISATHKFGGHSYQKHLVEVEKKPEITK